MKTHTLLPLLAASAWAFVQPQQIPKAETTKTDNFTWTDPFGIHLPEELGVLCSAELTFTASEYLLHDLFEHAPKGLWAYADTLKDTLSGKPYPGGWDGLDPHMYDRPLLSMSYADVPLPVREWIEEQQRGDDSDAEDEGKYLFAVFERQTDSEHKVTKTVTPAQTPEKTRRFRVLDEMRIVIFAPGALYRILPLWVAKGSGCKDQLLDLGNYSSKPADGAVIAWTTAHTTPNRNEGEREITFTVKAQAIQAAKSHDEKEEL
ncbi:hypothetical protein F503_03556 [Ophiostoma piceae UAMH 11346]|uniref:Uncharacterized protein n=1 Tax=Ophiostoma piceae (strain UAMH 11346) TaxID=1262450 RepID=S3BT96_OPHP1|nr:hypothetical protein F503_03556 [Ophiostoma piceae UAMH 11346]